MPVNDMWVKFKTCFSEAVKRFIPTIMTKTKYSLPWIDATIKRLMYRRQKLYLRARKSHDPDMKNYYKRFRAHVQKLEREMPIGNTFLIFSRLRTTPPTQIQNKKGNIKNFGHLSIYLRKTRFRSDH